MQTQISELIKSFKCASDENFKLKVRVQETEALLKAKTSELADAHNKKSMFSENKQAQIEKLTIEKQNIKIENLEIVLQDLRTQLNQSQAVSDELRNKNKQLLDSQNEFFSKTKKVCP